MIVLGVTTLLVFNKRTQEKERQLNVVGTEESQSIKDFEGTSSLKNVYPQDDFLKVSYFANGCFWCVEHDLAKVQGVQGVISGYMDGDSKNPTYENYAEGGHREVVEVTYDSDQVSYANLVEHILKHGDPTDKDGSFYDRGREYAPAIYYETDEEKRIAQSLIQHIDRDTIFAKNIVIEILPQKVFWKAEEYHQDYSEKNPIRYNYYRKSSGRDNFIEKHWGVQSEVFHYSQPLVSTTHHSVKEISRPWMNFSKPSDDMLRKLLTPLQYHVTQEEGTEQPFANVYDKHNEMGIYVDVVSGEPLYTSFDKYDSGTGWPSFVKPISDESITLHVDRGIFSERVEVRSRIANSHLGHVFDDGPQDRGGKRYCMNSAALRFIPKQEMEKQGYGAYLPLFKEQDEKDQ